MDTHEEGFGGEGWKKNGRPKRRDRDKWLEAQEKRARLLSNRLDRVIVEVESLLEQSPGYRPYARTSPG